MAREIPGRVTSTPQLSGHPRSLDSEFKAHDSIATQQPVSVSEPTVVEEAAPLAARAVPVEAPTPVAEPTAPAAIGEVSPVQGVETQGPSLSSTPAFGKFLPRLPSV